MNKKKGSRPSADMEISGTERVEPTPDILDALEQDYPLEASIADLVDNSIDARAKNILIRFMRKDGRLVSLCVADDGKGMDTKTIRGAMRFGERRQYTGKDLGMFGVGLKTASLSQADVLTVVSRYRGSNPVGRQWTKAGIKKHNWNLNIIKAESAATILGHRWGTLGPIRIGTVVRWDHIYDFERLRVGIGPYIDRAIERIQMHLGLKLHRFLERGLVKICVDVEDLDLSEVGPPTDIKAMNPFPARGANGARGFPKEFFTRFPGAGNIKMRGHIWQKRSNDAGYKLGGGKVAEHQGFYFYRHNRLIQDGGWCEIIGTSEPHLSLARVEVDIPDELRTYLKVRSNKAGVDVPATFSDAIFKAKARDGMAFREYLDKAEEVYRHRGVQKARPMLQPGDGIPWEVRAALERKAMRFHRGDGCSVTWGKLPGKGFLEIDQNKRCITLNQNYRATLLRGERGGKTDVPILRTLLYFVFESLLAGDRVGPVERFRLDAIKAAMNAALKLEKQWASK